MINRYEVEVTASGAVIKKTKYVYYTEKIYRNSEGKPRSKRSLRKIP